MAKGLGSLEILSLNEHALSGFVLHEYTWELEANTESKLPFRSVELRGFVAQPVLRLSRPPSRHRMIAEKYSRTSLPPASTLYSSIGTTLRLGLGQSSRTRFRFVPFRGKIRNLRRRGLASFGLPTFYEYMMGGLVLPSHESTWEIESYTGSNLPFWQRLRNFVITWHNVHLYYNDMAVNHHSLAEKYLGKNIPFLPEVFENVSIMLINQNDVLSFARPKLPNLITFSSLHIYNDLPPLPKKLKRFVDDAKNGFIYFNLGSNARSSMLPRETRQIFLDVFAKLPYKVLWKFEKELPEKPDNVFTVSWIPQQTILAHPNIKLFMYQEGVQSTEEAVHYAIPVLGLPILGDQDHQRNRMKTLGVAEVLDVRTLTRDELESNIHKMINDKKYKENMLKLRSLAKDTPYNFAEYISWWIEFVIRHKGAPQFHSSLVRLPWYQRHDMDLIIFLTVVAYIVFLIAIVIIIKFVLHTYERYYPVQKQKTS